MPNHGGNPSAAAAGIVSRSGSGYPIQSRNGRPGERRDTQTHISCNRCRKSLSTTIFVCTCDCVFCEGMFTL
jgi:hypothetical protein